MCPNFQFWGLHSHNFTGTLFAPPKGTSSPGMTCFGYPVRALYWNGDTSSSYVFTVSEHRDKILHRDDDGIIFSRRQIAHRDVTNNCRFQHWALRGFCAVAEFSYFYCVVCSGLFMRVYILYITTRGVPSSRRGQVDVRCKRLVELCLCCWPSTHRPLLRRGKRSGLCFGDVPTIAELIDRAGDELFEKVLCNPQHVLYNSLPNETVSSLVLWT